MLRKKPCLLRRMLIVTKLLFPEFKYFISELASFDTYSRQRKFKEMLLMESHIVEKGLSLKDTRVGFGVPKIKKLLQDLALYEKQYKDHETLFFVLSIVEAYLSFNSERDEVNTEIKGMYEELKSHLQAGEDYPNLCGGVVQLNKNEVMTHACIDYEGFVGSRHSIRQFTGEEIPMEKIKKALAIAEYTPSACNRQPWRNYIFTKKDNIIKILDIQSGARQFKDDVSCLILITATANAFVVSEAHQLYVNGGLYAMNLLFALHALGLGTIPLNMGITNDKLKAISSICGMDFSDTPILLIAVGQIPDEFAVAKSCRFPFSEYCMFD